MSTLNLGILAHIDAGKTSLTERLLHAAGIIDEIGSVDDGNTQTDSLALERQRGITIKSAVVSFVVDDVTINLIDTPGHPDFIAEVERVLSVLDGAVLVVSAVEGVQAQTRVLMRTLQRLHIPTLIFVNKIDRGGASYERTLQAISAKLTPAVIPMGIAGGLGGRTASYVDFTAQDPGFVAALTELIADHDDEFLADYLADDVSYPRLRAELAALVRRAAVHPVFFGSAITGAGVHSLMAGITRLLPVDDCSSGPPSGTVFKVERGPAGEKIAYVRMFSGTIRAREQLPSGRRITAIRVFEQGRTIPRPRVSGGRIAKVWGLGDIRIGDSIGSARATGPGQFFAPPTLETVVIPVCRGDKGLLRAALGQLAEQDPLINVRQDDVRQEISVSLYGEVQKEVIQATLADDYGLDVTFRETTTICVERPVGTASAVEFIGTDDNPFLATVGLRVEPAVENSGVEYRRATEVLGTMPPAFFSAVEETVHETLEQGICGWRVTDCVITLTHTGYYPRQSHAHQGFNKAFSSTAGDFRNLTPLVLMAALRTAGTAVYEPMNHFALEIPADLFGPILPALTRLRAIPEKPQVHGATCMIDGIIPAARVYELQQQLPALTRGEGVLETAFDRYQQVSGPPPTRPRTDHNPLDRKEYLLRVQRRV